MKIFFERLLVGGIASTTPFYTGKELPITREERQSAIELSSTATLAQDKLFLLVEPVVGMDAAFANDIKALVNNEAIEIIPELCDKEGRVLCAYAVGEWKSSKAALEID